MKNASASNALIQKPLTSQKAKQVQNQSVPAWFMLYKKKKLIFVSDNFISLMQKKSVVKIVVLSIFTIVLIGGGAIFFQRLRSDKQVYSINLQAHIPQNAKQVIEVRRLNDIKNIRSENKITQLLEHIGQELNCPFYLVDLLDTEPVIISKLSSAQESSLKNLINTTLYSEFPPQKRKYKNVDILFYPTKNANDFFVCAYSKGLFIAAYNYKAVQSVIDVEGQVSLLAKPFFEKVEPFFKSSSLVYYKNLEDISIAYSMSDRDSVLLLDGFLDKRVEKEIDSLEINRNLFPLNVEAFQIDRHNSDLSQTLLGILKSPFYTFQTDSATYLSVAGFDLDRYELYDSLNGMEKKLSKKNLVRHGYTVGKKYSIYSGSSFFTKEVFKSDMAVYFAFKDGYLISSNNKDALYRYILKSGSSDISLSLRTTCESYYYSKNPTKTSHFLLDKLDINQIPNSKEVSVEIYSDIDYHKIEVKIKHF